MSYELFFVGAGATLLGTLVGAFISARLTYGFQKKLLAQQIEFQREQARLDSEQRKQIADFDAEERRKLATEGMEILKHTRHAVRDLANHVASLNYNTAAQNFRDKA